MNDEDEKRFHEIVDTWNNGGTITEMYIQWLIQLCHDQALSLNKFYKASKSITDFADKLIAELGELTS